MISKAKVFFAETNNFTSVSYAGGLVGAYYDTNGVVKNCKNYGKITSNKYAGGLIGDGIISHCESSENQGEVSINKTDAIGFYAGGIAGQLKTTALNSKLKNLAKVESPYAEAYAGGIAGYIFEGGKFSECENSGKIIANHNGEAGGIVGECADECEFISCVNSGDIVGGSAAGGIVGDALNGFINSCTNSGGVEGSFYVGGIAGSYTVSYLDGDLNRIFTDAEGAVAASTNSGKITAGDTEFCYAGGIVGYLEKFDMISFDTNTNTGEISGAHTDPIANIGGKE